MRPGLKRGLATLALSLAFSASAYAATVVATTADAGGSVSVEVGDTLLVKMPGSWTPASDVTPALVFDSKSTTGSGAHAKTTITYSADSAGSASLAVQNTITHHKLSMLVDVMAPQN